MREWLKVCACTLLHQKILRTCAEAPPSFGPQLPTYDESEIANDVSSFRDLIYAGFMPFAPGSGLIAKRDESGASSLMRV